MKIKILSITLLNTLLSFITFGQKESWNWYFGENAGITFKSGKPTALPAGPISTWEGVATISDADGNLLFSTDGSSVYNSTNGIMINGRGLFGNSSSSQSAIIVKKPGSQRIYYIFTVDCGENFPGKGLNYSTVDMSLNGGLGEVISKNILLRSSAIEKLTVVQHRNKRDFWILINDWIDDDIYAYPVSCDSVGSVPVISKIGPFHNGNSGYLTGYLKASRQNDKIAYSISYKNVFGLMDFDNNTGIASNRREIVGNGTTFGTTYGVEFSPDGNYLYGSTVSSPKLFQFNIKAGTGLSMYNSRVLLATHNTIYTFNYYYYGALQLGPDGKIYSANNGDYSLGVINNPNAPGTLCNYVNNVVSLNGRRSLLGLPNFLTNYAYPNPADTVYASICKGQSYLLPDATKTDSAGIYISHFSSAKVCDSIIVTKVAITSPPTTALSASICEGSSYTMPSGRIVKTAGVYNDTVHILTGCDSVFVVNIQITPRINTVVNKSICEGESFLGHKAGGKYVDTFQAFNGCDSVRTLNLIVNTRPVLKVTRTICQGESFFSHTTAGTYFDTLKSSTDCDTIMHLILTVKSLPTPSLGASRSMCPGDSLTLFPGVFQSYIWQDGSIQNTFIAKSPGTYTVKVSDQCGTSQAAVIINEKACNYTFPSAFTPNFDGKNDTFIILNAGNIENYHLTVFTRWGTKVFETYNYRLGWDGKFGGKVQDPGMYVWRCSFSISSIKHNLKGYVTLIR